MWKGTQVRLLSDMSSTPHRLSLGCPQVSSDINLDDMVPAMQNLPLGSAKCYKLTANWLPLRPARLRAHFNTGEGATEAWQLVDHAFAVLVLVKHCLVVPLQQRLHKRQLRGTVIGHDARVGGHTAPLPAVLRFTGARMLLSLAAAPRVCVCLSATVALQSPASYGAC